MHYLCVVALLFLYSNNFSTALFAQNCTPDTAFADAPLGLYPTPFDAVVFPEGGLADFPATIGIPYELTFTVKLTDRISVSPLDLDVDSFALLNSDAIIGLPIGLDYACNPPNCVFPDTALGCIIISGTPIEANRIGDYNLQISGQLFANGEDTFDFNFPSPLIPGEYILSVNRSDSLDSDGDGITDSIDNCVNNANPAQTDMDADGTGAACDCDDSAETGAACILGCQPFYLDEDGDGFGNPLDSIIACSAPSGYVANNSDCDDTNEAINPDAVEILSNGIDENCNGLTDEMTDIREMDEHGIVDSLDNCPMVANIEQVDIDNDGFGAACDCNDSLANLEH